MDKRFLASCLVGAAGLALAACDSRPMDVRETFNMTPPVAHGTGAKTRLVTTTTPHNTIGQSEHGRVVPRQIVCAEASPDTASSLSSALTAAFSGAGEGKGISASAAGQFGKAVSESLVQLTERTATIQLLRDGYHRACEGYANGAISDITYALIISRLDEVMVTMMTSELAAGAFGRSLASTSGQAGFIQGGGDSTSVEEADKIVSDKTTEVRKTDDEIAAKEAELKPLKAKSQPTKEEEAKISTLEAQIASAKSARNTQLRQKGQAEAAAMMARLGKGGGFASQQGTGAGGIDAKVTPQIAEKLVEVYGRFMEGNPMKKMVVACVTALDRPPTATKTTMHDVCVDFMRNEARQAAQARIAGDQVEAKDEITRLRMEYDFRVRMAQVQAGAIDSLNQVCAGLSGTERGKCIEAVSGLLDAGAKPQQAALPAAGPKPAATSAPRAGVTTAPLAPPKTP